MYEKVFKKTDRGYISYIRLVNNLDIIVIYTPKVLCKHPDIMSKIGKYGIFLKII